MHKPVTESGVTQDKYGGILAAIGELRKEAELIASIKELVEPEAFLGRLDFIKKWMTYYVTELNKLGNDPKQQG